MHHLVIDGISWRILLEDLESLLVQHSQNQPLQLKPKTSSFAQWTAALSQYANSQHALKDLTYWQTQVNQRVPSLPVDFVSDPSSTTFESTIHLESSLDAEMTQSLLTDVPKVYQTQINDILMTALVTALGRWTNLQEFEIDNIDVINIALDYFTQEELDAASYLSGQVDVIAISSNGNNPQTYYTASFVIYFNT